MYPVSEAFLSAVKANTRKYYWTGRITTTAGTVYVFDQDDMVKGSGYITSQCCGSTEIELGTVYAAEMGISLFSDIDRYTLEDAKVELFYHLQVAGDSYERIPIEKSIADHSAYLLGAKNGSKLRYEGLKGCTVYKRAVQIIKDGGYATSLTYVEKLCSIIEKWNLTQIDVQDSGGGEVIR